MRWKQGFRAQKRGTRKRYLEEREYVLTDSKTKDYANRISREQTRHGEDLGQTEVMHVATAS